MYVWLPPGAAAAVAAARRVDPHRSPFVTYEPLLAGEPAWAYHAFKRWLVLHTVNPLQALDGLALALLARDA